jgi:hypothetical protein
MCKTTGFPSILQQEMSDNLARNESEGLKYLGEVEENLICFQLGKYLGYVSLEGRIFLILFIQVLEEQGDVWGPPVVEFSEFLGLVSVVFYVEGQEGRVVVNGLL